MAAMAEAEPCPSSERPGAGGPPLTWTVGAQRGLAAGDTGWGCLQSAPFGAEHKVRGSGGFRGGGSSPSKHRTRATCHPQKPRPALRTEPRGQRSCQGLLFLWPQVLLSTPPQEVRWGEMVTAFRLFQTSGDPVSFLSCQTPCLELHLLRPHVPAPDHAPRPLQHLDGGWRPLLASLAPTPGGVTSKKPGKHLGTGSLQVTEWNKDSSYLSPLFVQGSRESHCSSFSQRQGSPPWGVAGKLGLREFKCVSQGHTASRASFTAEPLTVPGHPGPTGRPRCVSSPPSAKASCSPVLPLP